MSENNEHFQTLLPDAAPADQWAIVELMGHVKTGAKLSKDTTFGTGMIRADVPKAEGFVTQLINPSSVYRITFCDEQLARACAKSSQAMPFQKWELRDMLSLPAPPSGYLSDGEHEDEHEEEEQEPSWRE